MDTHAYVQILNGLVILTTMLVALVAASCCSLESITTWCSMSPDSTYSKHLYDIKWLTQNILIITILTSSNDASFIYTTFSLGISIWTGRVETPKIATVFSFNSSFRVKSLDTDWPLATRKPLAMFKLRILKQDCDLYFLNELSGQFENLEPGKYLLGPTLHGIFSYKSMENHNIVSYDASAFERLSIMIAVHSEGRWRLRFRLVATNESGLIGFRMSSTLQKQNGRYILPYDQHNNVLILGIQPKEPSFKILFRIFANENGVIDDRIFSGYQAFATYDPTTMKGNFVLDDELDGETAKSKRYFNKHLYPRHSAPIESRT